MFRNLLLSGVARPYYARPGEGDTSAGEGEAGGEPAQGAAGEGEAGGEPAQGAAGEGEAGGEPAQGAAGEGEAGEDGGAPAIDAAPPSDWKDRQLKRQYRKLQDSEREKQDLAAALEAANETLKRLQGDAEAPAIGGSRPGETGALSQEDVQREAQRMVAQERFNDAANAAHRDGSERYKDWDKTTDTLQTLGGFDLNTMQGVLATDDPAKVLHALGSNPDEYERVMGLPPAKRLAEIVKLGLPEPKSPASQRPSGAPAPITPVGGRNRGDPNALSDDLTDEEWYSRRKAQREARRRQQATA